jgi:cytochrome c6
MSRKLWWGLAAAAALAVAALAAPAQTRFPADDIARGHAQYDKSCVHCHGFHMVNSGTTVFDLRRFPVDDADRFFNSVSNGKGSMPSFKDALTPEQMKLLWAYVGSRGGKEP